MSYKGKNVFKSLDKSFQEIVYAYNFLENEFANKREINKGGEWLLDNLYLIEKEYKEIKVTVNKKNYKKLPLNINNIMDGYPRIYKLAVDIVSFTEGSIDLKTVREFVKNIEKEITFTMEELWILPVMIKIVLIQNIGRISNEVVYIEREKNKAEVFADLLVNAISDKEMKQELEKLYKLKIDFNPYFTERFLKILRNNEIHNLELYEWIEKSLHTLDMSIENILFIAHKDESNKGVVIGNCISSLRNLVALNWESEFESLSKVHEILNRDPMNQYSNMDYRSREYYRKNITILSKKLKRSETFIASIALQCAESANNEEEKDYLKHIGYYIVDKGKEKLIKKVKGKLSFTEKVRKILDENKTIIYIQSILFFLTILVTAIISLSYNYDTDFKLWKYILCTILIIFPCSHIVIYILNWVITHTLQARFIPKLDFEKDLGIKNRTIVVIPTLINSKESIDELLYRLEIYFLGNKFDNLYFAILGDFKDSDVKEEQGEVQLINYALSCTEKLNLKYNFKDQKKFFFFLRERLYNEKEGYYLAWERKRGKLMEFNELIRGKKDTTYKVISSDINELEKANYIITLDQDTELPRDKAKEMVGAMAHILNFPHISEGTQKVFRGYGILQPRIGISISSANKTVFAKVFSGETGIDTYSTAVSDVYQDLFGEGIFTGKGIYHIDTFRTMLENQIPENLVLSHDLLEGSFVRAGLLTDVELIDSYPPYYNASAKRLHRWVRGDWQILRYLKFKSPLSLLRKYEIFDNLRRSLIAPFTMLLVFCAVLGLLPNGLNKYFVLALLALGISAVFNIIENIMTPIKCLNVESRICGIKRILEQLFLSFTFLPHKAILMIDAISRTLYRLTISKRNLLQWQCAEDVEKSIGRSKYDFFRLMYSSTIISVLLLIISFYKSTSLGIILVVPCMIWFFNPLIAYYVSLPINKHKDKIKKEEKEILQRISKKTWLYFKEFVNEENNYLGPDNYQEDPFKGIAHRTSPTNIGMCLMANICALDLSYIDFKECIDRSYNTVTNIEDLEKFHGHLYNWYNTKTKKPLYPVFVSFVDSGNLVSYYLLCAKTIEDKLKDNETVKDISKETLNKAKYIVKKLNDLAYKTDFNILYNKDRNLFSIGYDMQNKKLCNSYYDLLASEARQGSFVAIAKGDVPKEHWFKLGRAMTTMGGYKGLVSWSGTMFEYFMPLLLMKTYPNTILDKTYASVIKNQKTYVKRRNIPWGISESGYYEFDMHNNYQYKAFGIPGMGLKRGLKDELVISPYSTILALQKDFKVSMDNIKKLIKMGIEGKYGFYEAVDYTLGRTNKKGKIIKSFMIHHQGMSLMALNNMINNNILQERFHNIPIIKATELLLQEKIPKNVVYNRRHKYEMKENRESKQKIIERKFYSAKTVVPEVQLMSNGRLNFMISNSGSGYCRENNIYLYRWREDVTQDNTGLFVYLKDMKSNKYWSITYAPTMEHGDYYEVSFTQDRAKFIKSYEDITTETSITLSSQHNVELRNIDISNNCDETREIEIVTYGEIVLADYNADLVHPAFSNLFITTEYIEEEEVLIGKRTSRMHNEKTNYIFHTLNVKEDNRDYNKKLQCETARINFIGRGRSKRNPIALECENFLNTVGVVLDPIISLKRKIILKPKEKVQVIIVTGISSNKEEALKLSSIYREFYNVERSFNMALVREQLQMMYLGYKSPQVNLFCKMASRIIFISPLMKRRQNYIKKVERNQSALWAYGISGDLPMVLIKIKNEKNLYKVKQLLDAHEYWRLKGLKVDLIVINEEEISYLNSLEIALKELVNTSNCRDLISKSGGVFILNKNILEHNYVDFLEGLSRIVINSEIGFIGEQIDGTENIKVLGIQKSKNRGKENKIKYNKINYLSNDKLEFYNGYGGFNEEGNEYKIILDKFKNTPAPWVNVISNEKFGFLISESGSSYTWNKNSRENKITLWNNDWICDTPSEILYIKDRECDEIWSITPKPIRDNGEYIINHGFGYSKFRHEAFSIMGEEIMFSPINEGVKIIKVKLKNNSEYIRKLRLCYYVHLVLGVVPCHTASKIVTFRHKKGFLYAKNPYSINFSNNYTFLSMTSLENISYTTDRTEFIGRGGNLESPEALEKDKLYFMVGSGVDSCFAMEGELELKPKEEQEFIIVFGQEDTLEGAEKVVDKYQDKEKVENEYNRSKNYFKELLGKVQVKTEDKAMNILLNGWLMYQTIACRLWARSGFYQCGGAYGFRDQLQDVMSLNFLDSSMTKKQILYSASRQYLQGDVQHWWHPVVDSGIRTRFSDDLLWLPYVTLDYIKNTGDYTILKEEVNYLEDEPLKQGEDERYSISKISDVKESIYGHCKRALKRAMKFGPHKLPLMGSGDWNDGMNTVGNKGKGESVWLSWFLYDILEDFIPISQLMRDIDFKNKCEEIKDSLRENTNKEAWDGRWYRRAFFDDGTPLGSDTNSECKIDSLAQSWAVISEGGDEEKIKVAMGSLEKYLIKEDNKIILLLNPAFSESNLEPGYIKSYVKGVRENGGQYTHAATWVILAMCKMKEYDKAFKLFSMINPINHTQNKEQCDIYKTEPYVMTADVYGVEPHMGRGGWSWYTGTSSWMYRVGIEGILGLKLKGNLGFTIEPCVPYKWDKYEINYTHNKVLYNIKVCRKNLNTEEIKIYVDGKLQKDNIVKYSKEKEKIDVLVEI